jgi:hypothetical protein
MYFIDSVRILLHGGSQAGNPAAVALEGALQDELFRHDGDQLLYDFDRVLTMIAGVEGGRDVENILGHQCVRGPSN